MMDGDRKDDDLDALLKDARQKYEKCLNAGVSLVMGSSQLLANDADVELRAALKILVDAHYVFEGANSPNEAFINVKKWAERAFPKNPSDALILANSATPDLVRYLLSSLGKYDGMPANLATAFGLKGAGSGLTTEVQRLEGVIIAAAVEEYERSVSASLSHEALKKAVEDAAYEKFVSEKRHKIRPDPKGEKKYRSEIRARLNTRFGWE